jgi:hypothetical protein
LTKYFSYSRKPIPVLEVAESELTVSSCMRQAGQRGQWCWTTGTVLCVKVALSNPQAARPNAIWDTESRVKSDVA